MATHLTRVTCRREPACGPVFFCHRLHVRSGGTVTTSTDPGVA